MQNQLRVVPVVGLLAKIEDFSPVLNCDEVDAVFDVPLEMFLKVSNFWSIKLKIYRKHSCGFIHPQSHTFALSMETINVKKGHQISLF